MRGWTLLPSMLYSFIHPGSGLGNQLHRIVAGKVLALDKGYEYSAIGREYFKGISFMNIDFGNPNNIPIGLELPAGKITIGAESSIPLWEEKTNYFNPESQFIEDNTIIDGEFQDERYFEHRLDEIDKWLKVSWPFSGVEQHNLCAIGFRGGEFYTVAELGLPKEYFDKAIEMMFKINPLMRFEVHTDDPILARQFFPAFPIIHDIAINWTTMRYARYAIIANSSFYILPRLLMHHGYEKTLTIAPRGWARRNIGEWSRPDNYYKSFLYI